MGSTRDVPYGEQFSEHRYASGTIDPGRECWPKDHHPFVIGQLGMVFKEQDGRMRFVDAIILCHVPSIRASTEPKRKYVRRCEG